MMNRFGRDASESDGAAFGKQLLWVVVIAFGVFFGAMVYEAWTAYRVRAAMSEVVEFMEGQVEGERKAAARRQAQIQQQQAQRAAEQEQKRQEAIEREAKCAYNEDSEVCVCINEKTGIKISLPHAECKKKAREITW